MELPLSKHLVRKFWVIEMRCILCGRVFAYRMPEKTKFTSYKKRCAACNVAPKLHGKNPGEYVPSQQRSATTGQGLLGMVAMIGPGCPGSLLRSIVKYTGVRQQPSQIIPGSHWTTSLKAAHPVTSPVSRS